MKKKIIALAAALMLFTGVVSASSINGDYKGNPIVKVISNGKQLESDEVPAQIYDGHTVVPISLLRQLGLSVDWNADTYSVDVILPKNTATNTTLVESIKLISDEALKLGAKTFKLSYDGSGPYAEVNYNLTGNDLQIISNISLVTLGTDANELYVNNFDNGVRVEVVKILRKDIEDYKSGKITVQQFTDRWEYRNLTNNSPQQNQQPISVPAQTPSPSYVSGVIESKIDGDFEGWDGETTFKLTNGQIWQQDSYAYTYHYAYSPKVLIYKSGGRYKMKVDGVKDEIFVKQLK